jgi:radical SAM superfamily enzyme YgiQ (UPF0313 family)
MKAAGCYRITFGIESGNDETRKFLGKPYPLEQAKRMIRHAKKIGLWTICTNIIGFPYESREAIMDTIAFNCNSGTDMAVFYLLCPHPGTRVYDIFKKENLLNLDRYLVPEYAQKQTGMENIGMKLAGRGAHTKHHSIEELHQYVSVAYKKFFQATLGRLLLNPIPIFYKIRSFEDFRYMLKIAGFGLKASFSAITGRSFFSQNMRKRTDKK